jgi:hypothetical protein
MSPNKIGLLKEVHFKADIFWNVIRLIKHTSTNVLNFPLQREGLCAYLDFLPSNFKEITDQFSFDVMTESLILFLFWVLQI